MSRQGNLFRGDGPPEPRERTEGDRHYIALLGGDGILTSIDLPGLKAGVRRVWDLMKDGEWHSAASIRQVAGDGTVEASEGLRRMRELRALLPEGYTVHRASAGGRLFKYRIGEDA